MKKVIITLLLLTIVSSLCAFAGTYNLPFKLKLRKDVSYYVAVTFQNSEGTTITSCPLDLADTSFNETQVKIITETNKTEEFALKVTFTALKCNFSSNVVVKGLYKATVGGKTATFANENDTPYVEITPGTVKDSSNGVTVYSQDMKFDFRDYINTYSYGDYTGDITVEVIPV